MCNILYFVSSRIPTNTDSTDKSLVSRLSENRSGKPKTESQMFLIKIVFLNSRVSGNLIKFPISASFCKNKIHLFNVVEMQKLSRLQRDTLSDKQLRNDLLKILILLFKIMASQLDNYLRKGSNSKRAQSIWSPRYKANSTYLRIAARRYIECREFYSEPSNRQILKTSAISTFSEILF